MGFFILKSIALNCTSPDVRSRMPSRAVSEVESYELLAVT